MKKYIIQVSVSLLIALSLIAFFADKISGKQSFTPLDTQYIETMRSYDNEIINNIPDTALVGIAKDICSDFMFGYTLDDVINIRLQGNSDESQLVFKYVLLNGTKYFCPDYRDYAEGLTW